jgi:hypothetical protein
MRGINHLQIGKSKIIDSPLTIMIEWIYAQFRRLRRAWRRFISALFPRRPELPVGHRDSRLVGRIIFAGDRGDGPAIHNLRLEFWGRTFWFAWRKIAEGRTDGEGYFALRFPLRAARGVFIRSLSFEIQKTTRVYFQGDHPHFHFDLFKLSAWTITCAQSRWITGSTTSVQSRPARSSTTQIPTRRKSTPLAVRMR